MQLKKLNYKFNFLFGVQNKRGNFYFAILVFRVCSCRSKILSCVERVLCFRSRERSPLWAGSSFHFITIFCFIVYCTFERRGSGNDTLSYSRGSRYNFAKRHFNCHNIFFFCAEAIHQSCYFLESFLQWLKSLGKDCLLEWALLLNTGLSGVEEYIRCRFWDARTIWIWLRLKQCADWTRYSALLRHWGRRICGT